MSINPIEQIHQFNHDAGLVDKGYSDFLESSFQIEEALEGFPPTAIKSLQATIVAANYPQGTETYEYNPKGLSRTIISCMYETSDNRLREVDITDVERLDKACDAVVFAVGSMTKLGLSVDQITRSLNTVMAANFQKLAMPKDSYGKLMKPENFIGPEEYLQKILDERTINEN